MGHNGEILSLNGFAFPSHMKSLLLGSGRTYFDSTLAFRLGGVFS